MLLTLLLAALGPGAAADVTVFVGPDGGAGNVLVLDEQGGSTWPAGLQGIVLRPLDCTGRTRLAELLPLRAHPRLDVPGASRLQLPQDRGSLYRYRRDDPAGGPAAFGFFLVDPDGRARIVHEQPGMGTRGTEDPLATYVAVSERGDAILLGTHPEAGGDLIEVDLATGTSVNRTEDLAPRSFRTQGLALLTSLGVGLSDEGPLRFSRRSTRGESGRSFQASAVPDWPPWTGEDLVYSADESSIAVVAGEDPSLAFVHVFGHAGPAWRATHVPARLSGAGFLPEHPAGPTLALSPDGARVAWRSEGHSRECWLRDVRAPQGAPDVLVTGNANFEYTLNDTGVISFLSPDDMIVLVGEDEGAGLAEGDLFHVKIGPAGRLSIVNLTRTGPPGDSPPFDYGRLVLADGLQQLPGTPAWLAFDPGEDKSAGTWLRLDASGRAPVELLSACGPPRLLEVTSRDLYADPGQAVPGFAPRALIRLALDGSESSSWQLPGDAALDCTALSRTTEEFAAVLATPGVELLSLVEPMGHPLVLAASGPFLFGPTLGFAGGSVHVTIGNPAEWFVLALSRSSTTVLAAGLPQSFVLPGS